MFAELTVVGVQPGRVTERSRDTGMGTAVLLLYPVFVHSSSTYTLAKIRSFAHTCTPGVRESVLQGGMMIWISYDTHPGVLPYYTHPFVQVFYYTLFCCTRTPGTTSPP